MPRQKGVGMRKPKKKKVEARQEASDAAREQDAAEEELEEVAAAPTTAPVEAPAKKSPGKRKREEAKDEMIDLYELFDIAKELEVDARKRFKLAERIYEAKQRRIEKSQAGTRHGCPFGELERIYKAKLELLYAQLGLAEAEGTTTNSEANYLGQRCRVLENAKLRRIVSRSMGGAKTKVR